MTGDIPGIFSHYGISNPDVDTLVDGTVGRNGNVTVNGQVVATNAVSTGRHFIPGSTHVKSINVYERPTSVSFRSSSLPAFVKMENGQFKHAIIKSCGNPVKAVPVKKEVKKVPVKKEVVKKVPVKKEVKKPAVKIEKKVSKKEVKKHEQFAYTITVRNTGETTLNDVTVVDRAPSGVSFVEAENTTATEFRTTLDSMPIGASETFTINAKMDHEVKGEIKNIACVKTREIKRETCAEAVHRMRIVKKVKELPPKEEPAPEPEPEPEPEEPQPQPEPEPEPEEPQPVKKVVKKKIVEVPREEPIREEPREVEGKESEVRTMPVTGPGLVFGAAGSISVATYLGSLAYSFLRRRLL
jgi:uncharacterized repeat protein (TIGR01451 family)